MTLNSSRSRRATGPLPARPKSSPRSFKQFAAPSMVAAAALGSQTAGAAIVAPPGLNPGDKFHLVFLTVATSSPTLATTGAYDAIVSGEANSAGLGTYDGNPVTWKALISHDDGTVAINRFNPARPVYRLDGVKVVDNGADLWDGSLDNPITVRSNLTSPTVMEFGDVWTGTRGTGAVWKGLGSLPNGMPAHSYGRATTLSGKGWIELFDSTATNGFGLYAYSNELTVPVPEPPAAGLLATGLVWLLNWARRRRT